MSEFLDFLDLHSFEVAFPAGDIGLTLKPTFRFKPAITPANALFSLSQGGSGFVLGVPNNELFVAGHRVRALLATAAHCLYFPSGITREGLLSFMSNRGRLRQNADWELLHYFGSMEGTESEDPITRAIYPLPNDLALLLLYEYRNVKKLEIGTPEIGTEIITAGFPILPKANLLRAAPALADRTQDVHEVERVVKRAFLNFKSGVYTRGPIFAQNQYYLAVGSGSCCGMSGSPVFRADDRKVVGMLLGGPVVDGMHQALQLSQSILTHKPEAQVKSQLQDLVTALRRLGLDKDADLIDVDLYTWDAGTLAAFAERHTYDLVRQAKQARHNICLSVEHPVFRRAIQAGKDLENMGPNRFRTAEHMARALGLVS